MTDESKPYQGMSALEAMQWMLDRAEAKGEGDGPFEKYLRAELALYRDTPKWILEKAKRTAWAPRRKAP